MKKSAYNLTQIPGARWETYGSLALSAGQDVEPSVCGHDDGAKRKPYLYVVESRGEAMGIEQRLKPRASRAKKPAALASSAIWALSILVTLCAAFVLVSGNGGEAYSKLMDSSIQTEYISISEGESLWHIASARPVQGISTQDEVRWIMEQNGLMSSALMPGQVLLVPISA